MAWLDRAVPLVARFEGFRAHRYIDAVGVPTIGYGETKPAIVARSPISRIAARKLLRKRLAEFGRGVDRLVKVRLNERQMAALTSFAYNVGLGAFGDSTLLRKLNTGNYGAVPGELAKWVNGGGRPLPGLVTRRRVEANLWRAGGRAERRRRARLRKR